MGVVKAGGIVLCGGRSTRMGTSKALLPFGNETMLQRVVRMLSGVLSPIVVVAALEQSLPELPPSTTVARDEQEGRGPLEALRAGLKALPTNVDVAYVTGCDAPLLVPGFVQRMVELLGDCDVAVAEIDGFAHPLSAVYRRRTLPHIEALLAENRLRPVFLFEAVRTRRIQRAELSAVDPELKTLRNVNTRDEYLAALTTAGLAPPVSLRR
jgi:molybdopterin-guanine dinucleotide biosynthesis protein A